jgi:hypothetical protein
MKSLIDLWCSMAEDSAIRCRVSTVRDQQKIVERVEHEGLSFLTITLPILAKGLQKGLEQGESRPHDYPGFRCRGSFPIFLSGLFDQVFNGCDGSLLDNPDPDSIQMIRQLSLAFQKVELDCSDSRVDKAFTRYIENEKDVRATDQRLDESDYRRFKRMAGLLFGKTFDKLNAEIDSFGLFPKHGPGATADKLMGNQKYDQLTWPERLEKVFPFLEYALPNARYYSYLDRVEFLPPRAEIPVRVITVPKTLETPRIIAIEPTAMQYAQQAISGSFYRYLPSETHGMIGFFDQEVNNQMAKDASITGKYSTIDLSDASDLVSNQLVRAMVSAWPSLLEGLDATRSRKADVPGYGLIRLAKYASMGSALCFPVEAMVFLTCVFLGIERSSGTRLTADRIKRYAGSVRVFGDDIIVPSDHAVSVIAELEHFGARVNRHKTFMNSKFRESCGKEYFDGHDVSTTRVRQMPPTSLKDATGIVSWVATRNLLYKQGMWKATQFLDVYLGDLLRYFPHVGANSPLLGRESFLSWERSHRLHPRYHYPVVKGWYQVSRLPVNRLDDIFALQKFFLKQSDQPSEDKRHLERSGRPLAVDIKLGIGSEE